MRAAIHYEDPDPILTDEEVRALQDAWDAESLMPPTVQDDAWLTWQLPLGLLALVMLWTLVGGLAINWASGR